MNPQTPIHFRLQRPAGPLPSQEDFGFSADQTDAWRFFENHTMEEAYRRFIGLPESYQEHFAWMRPAAFAYYFPVIDTYLREEKWEDPWDYCCAWILGCDVRFSADTDEQERIKKSWREVDEEVAVSRCQKPIP
jgi:hypothetical protein